MNRVSFSVIIPLYNKEPYIARAIRSVLVQSWPDYEILVVDDASTDNGIRVLSEEFQDSRIRLIKQENSGAGAARNRGLTEMRGDIAAFLDADDEWLPTHLRDLAEIASKYPEAGLLATGFRAVYRRGLEFDHAIDCSFPRLVDNYYRLAASGHTVHVSAVGVSRMLLAQGVMFREDAPVVEDQEFYARAALHSPIAYHPNISSIYHHETGGSVMATARWVGVLPLTAQSVSDTLRQGTVPARLRESAAAYLAWIIEQHAMAGLALDRKAEALSFLRQSLLQPLSGPCKRRLGWFGLVVRYAPFALLKRAVRFRRSRWFLPIAELFSTRTRPESLSSAVRATTRRHGASVS